MKASAGDTQFTEIFKGKTRKTAFPSCAVILALSEHFSNREESLTDLCFLLNISLSAAKWGQLPSGLTAF